jgi:hypothetical protein
VRQDRFRQILHDHPQGWEVLARHLHDRAAAAEERICLMANEPASQRLAVFLLQLLAYDDSARPPGDQVREVPLPLSKAQLAEWIGVSRETVERVLRGWVRDGMVKTGRSSLLIKDVLHLQKIAGASRPFPLPSRIQGSACCARPAWHGEYCRSSTQITRPGQRRRPAGPALLHHRAQTRLPGRPQRPDPALQLRQGRRQRQPDQDAVE